MIEPIRLQKTIYYDAESEQDGGSAIFDPYGNSYVRMFIEDSSLQVMPIGGRTHRRTFKVELSASAKNIKGLIASALSTYRASYREDLAGAICDFFRQCAATITARDRAIYEIVYFQEPTSMKIIGFELYPIDEVQIVKKAGRIYQYVPKRIAEKRNVSEHIPLSENDLVIFCAPPRFREALRVMREDLSRFSSISLADLFMESTNSGLPYDFKAHQRSMKLALADIVRPIGWTARQAFNDVTLSFYWIQMSLLFHEFKIELREEMLKTLNAALLTVGSKIGFHAQVKISGLATIEDVRKARGDLESGKFVFTEVMKVFDQN